MLAAASKGLNVVGVDRKSVIGMPVQCAEFVPVPLRSYCAAAGIVSQPVSSLITTLPDGSQTQAAMQGLMIRRSCLDQNLVERGVKAGARYYSATQLLSIRFNDHEALVRTPLGLKRIKYRFVIAADGPCSQLARLLGLPALTVIKTQQYTVPLVKPLTDTYVWLSEVLPGGYAWLFPKRNSAHVGCGAVSEADLKYHLQRLHRKLVSEGLVEAQVVARTGGKIPVAGIRSVLTTDQVLFVGDAAGLTHPITGAGIASAVASGEMAGHAVAEALYCDNNKALTEYATEIQDVYGPSYSLAVSKRQYLLDQLQLNIPRERESLFRSSWIGFKNYYRSTEL